jgi:hypothetical protein
MTVLSLDEHRAHRTEQERDDQPADRAHSLEQARQILARLGGYNQLTDLEPADAGACDDCHEPIEHRWRHGQLDVCRPCAMSRLHAATTLDQQTTSTGTIGPTVPSFFDYLIHWTRACYLELNEHELRGRLNSYRLINGHPPRYLLSNEQKRTLIRLHRHLRDQHERGGQQRPNDLEAWVRAHADRLTLTELERQLDAWHVPAGDRYALGDLLVDRRRQLGITEAA